MHKNFELILKEYGPTVYRLALSRTGDPEKSIDIYQNTFLALLEKKPSFAHKNQLRVWLIRTCRYLILQEHRTRPHQSLDGTEIPYTDSLVFELHDVITSLPETLRDAAVLFYIEDMSIRDIARALEITVPAVKSRLHRARNILKTVLEEE